MCFFFPSVPISQINANYWKSLTSQKKVPRISKVSAREIELTCLSPLRFRFPDSTSSEEAASTTQLTRTRDLQLHTCPVKGLRKDVFPEGEAKRKLLQFLDQHRPIDPKVRLLRCYQSKSHCYIFAYINVIEVSEISLLLLLSSSSSSSLLLWWAKRCFWSS